MTALAHVLDVLAAVTPTPGPTSGPRPGPTTDPALPAVVQIGPAGEWFGPTVALVVALIIDGTAAGETARRDRFAAVLTYVAMLGFITIYGWSDDIEGQFTGWSWELAGSGLSLLVHLAFLALLIGDGGKWTKRFSGKFGPRFGFGAPESDVVGRLNTKLHLAAAVTACSYVLARGPLAVIPHRIGDVLSFGVAKLIQLLIHGLGG